MKITKFVHSCVLVEREGTAILFDPGIFSWNSGLINIETLPALSAVVVSHGHPDHCGEPFVRALVAKYPEVQWFAPVDTHETLQSWGVTRVVNSSIGNVQVQEVDHAPVEPFSNQVANLITNWDGLVTHPGDTHELSQTSSVLFLPVQAPWGTTIRAVNLALELKPKFVLPIHDWMWRDEWREMSYDRIMSALESSGITFLRPTDGQVIEIDL